MSKPKKKRERRYKPREVQSDPVSWAIAGVHTFPVKTQEDVMALTWAAFDKLREGVAGREHWNIVAQSLNVAEALAGLKIGSNLLPEIYAGMAALHEIALRIMKKGRTALYAEELTAIRGACTLYKIQLGLCTQAEYSRALKRVKDCHLGGATINVAKMYEQMAQEAA